eukprot:351943-Chlamydomonas_euryale.AAC.10
MIAQCNVQSKLQNQPSNCSETKRLNRSGSMSFEIVAAHKAHDAASKVPTPTTQKTRLQFSSQRQPYPHGLASGKHTHTNHMTTQTTHLRPLGLVICSRAARPSVAHRRTHPPHKVSVRLCGAAHQHAAQRGAEHLPRLRRISTCCAAFRSAAAAAASAATAAAAVSAASAAAAAAVIGGTRQPYPGANGT